MAPAALAPISLGSVTRVDRQVGTMTSTGIGQGANDARVPTSRPSVTSRSNPLHEAARLRSALRALLLEAKSGQHRRDRLNRECKAMEEAIAKAESALRR